MPAAPNDVAHECVVLSAAAHGVPPDLLVAIRKQENGEVGKVSHNTDESIDMGPMQVNDIHLEDVQKKWGLTQSDLVNHECANYFVAADLLRGHLARNKGDVWKSMGDYHSKTQEHHWTYRPLVKAHHERLLRSYGPYVNWLRQAADAVRRGLFSGVESVRSPMQNRAETKELVNPYRAKLPR